MKHTKIQINDESLNENHGIQDVSKKIGNDALSTIGERSVANISLLSQDDNFDQRKLEFRPNEISDKSDDAVISEKSLDRVRFQ